MQIFSKGVSVSDYGTQDFVGAVIGGPAAAVCLVTCIERLTVSRSGKATAPSVLAFALLAWALVCGLQLAVYL